MKYVTVSRVPGPFAEGPQFDEEGELIPGSFPSGLPHEGMKGWTKLAEAQGNKWMVEFVAEDNWPVDGLPGGWKAVASYIWDGVAQQEHDENGDPIGTPYNVEVATDEAEYQGYFPEDTEYKRHHSYLGWPTI